MNGAYAENEQIWRSQMLNELIAIRKLLEPRKDYSRPAASTHDIHNEACGCMPPSLSVTYTSGAQ